jgi:hypothetical protein
MSRSVLLVPVLLSLGSACPLWSSSSAGGRPVFAYEDDSLRATLTLIGGRLQPGPDSLPTEVWRIACGPARDSAGEHAASAQAPAAWYEVALGDKRTGRVSRFPVDGDALRKGLSQACADGPAAAPRAIAAGLSDLAVALKVRMHGLESGAGK